MGEGTVSEPSHYRIGRGRKNNSVIEVRGAVPISLVAGEVVGPAGMLMAKLRPQIEPAAFVDHLPGRRPVEELERACRCDHAGHVVCSAVESRI